MCCMSSHKALARIRKRKQPFFAWKVVCHTGQAYYNPEYRYRSGWNRPAEKRGTGLHVYRYRPNDRFGRVVVRVRVLPRHVLGAEPAQGVYPYPQDTSELEVSRLFIYKADWRKAGLP